MAVETFQFSEKQPTPGLNKRRGVVRGVGGCFLAPGLYFSTSFWTFCVDRTHCPRLSFWGGHFQVSVLFHYIYSDEAQLFGKSGVALNISLQSGPSQVYLLELWTGLRVATQPQGSQAMLWAGYCSQYSCTFRYIVIIIA